jgi:hypothetical protein
MCIVFHCNASQLQKDVSICTEHFFFVFTTTVHLLEQRYELLSYDKHQRFDLLIIARSHWWGLYVKKTQYRNVILPSLHTLAIMIISITVDSPKMTKASK